MLENVRRTVAAWIPGTVPNIAQRKRQMERELRAKGYSRTHAVAVVADHFKKPLQGKQ